MQNAHVQPAFAGVLNAFAVTPVNCRISVKTEDGDNTYDGLYPSTYDAVIDAHTRVGMRPCKIKVRALSEKTL